LLRRKHKRNYKSQIAKINQEKNRHLKFQEPGKKNTTFKIPKPKKEEVQIQHPLLIRDLIPDSLHFF